MIFNRLSLLIGSALLMNTVHAQTVSEDWLWVDSSDDPNTATAQVHQAHYNSMGTPLTMTNINDKLNENLLDGFYALVPEGLKVEPALLNNTFNNISVKAGFTDVVTVKVAFLNEGAGYKNTLGYFIFDTQAPPTKETIGDVEHVLIFPNSSAAGSGGELRQGDQVDLKIQLLAGQSIGFFVASNNWDGWYGGQKSNFMYGQPFYSLPQLNPTVGLGNKYHVLFSDTLSTTGSADDVGFFAYGFEDIRTDMGDKDFNDLIFNVEVTPLAAIDNLDDAIKVKSVKDTEITKQGKLAFEDNWPVQGDYDFNDAVVSYDLTKLITTQEVTQGNDTEMVDIIQSLSIDYEIEAIGATFRNGLALSLPNVALANIDSLSLVKRNNAGQQVAKYAYANGEFTQNDVSVNGFDAYQYPLALDSDDARVVITLTENIFEELSVYNPNTALPESLRCMYRTSRDPGVACASTTTTNTWQLNIVFKHDLDSQAHWLLADAHLQAVNYDHFMFASEKGNPDEAISVFRFERFHAQNDWFSQWRQGFNDFASVTGPGRCLEIHLSDYSGTQWFEMEGTYRDPAQFSTSVTGYDIDADLQRAFVVKDQNLPWVLDLPASWQHPLETQDISRAYPLFIDWLENPNQHADWYKNNTQSQFIYQPQ